MKAVYFKSSKKLILYAFLFCITILFSFIILFTVNHKIENSQNIDINLESNNYCNEDNSEMIKREEFLMEQYKEKKLIALTFDDGPGKYTEYLVDELKKREIKATFFVLGECAQNRQSTIKYIVDNGNEIGIHSYVHKLFTRISDEEIEQQIDKTRNVIYSACDVEIKLIRVPYGSTNSRITNVLENNQLTNVLWDVDSKDWKFKNTNKIYNYTLKRITGNDIILMHDIYNTSVEAAIKLVDTLKSECYTFVTVSQLLHIRELSN